MARNKSGGHADTNPDTSTSARILSEIAMHLADIAQSLREQTEIQRQTWQVQSKGRARVVSIHQAKYDRDHPYPPAESLPGKEAGAEVPGFRRR
jgi:hypothetical protein